MNFSSAARVIEQQFYQLFFSLDFISSKLLLFRLLSYLRCAEVAELVDALP